MRHPQNPGNTHVYGPAGVWRNDKGFLPGMVIWSSLMKSILMEAATFLFVLFCVFFLYRNHREEYGKLDLLIHPWGNRFPMYSLTSQYWLVVVVRFSHLLVDCGCPGLGEHKTPSNKIEQWVNLQGFIVLHHSVRVKEQVPTAPGVTCNHVCKTPMIFDMIWCSITLCDLKVIHTQWERDRDLWSAQLLQKRKDLEASGSAGDTLVATQHCLNLFSVFSSQLAAAPVSSASSTVVRNFGLT